MQMSSKDINEKVSALNKDIKDWKDMEDWISMRSGILKKVDAILQRGASKVNKRVTESLQQYFQDLDRGLTVFGTYCTMDTMD